MKTRTIWILIAIIIIVILGFPLSLWFHYSVISDNEALLFEWNSITNEIQRNILLVSTCGSLLMLFAIITPFILGWIKRPDLNIEVGNITGQGTNHRFLHLLVKNLPIQDYMRYVQQRDIAFGCRVELIFINISTKQQALKTILARWDSEPEPIIPIASAGKIEQVVATPLVPSGQIHNLEASDNGSTIAVALKYQGELNAYAFNSYSYYFPLWANPEWKLESGDYILKATASAGQQSCTRYFKLINRGIDFDNFILEPYRNNLEY